MASAPFAGIQTLGRMSLGLAHTGRSKAYTSGDTTRHITTAGNLKAILKAAKGGCLAVLMADAGWHGKVTGLRVEPRMPSQKLREVPESMLRRMRPDTLESHR